MPSVRRACAGSHHVAAEHAALGAITARATDWQGAFVARSMAMSAWLANRCGGSAVNAGIAVFESRMLKVTCGCHVYEESASQGQAQTNGDIRQWHDTAVCVGARSNRAGTNILEPNCPRRWHSAKACRPIRLPVPRGTIPASGWPGWPGGT